MKFWEQAKTVTDEMDPHPLRREKVFAMVRQHFKLLVTKAGHHPDDVLEAWRWLRTPKPDGMGFSDATVAALLNGNPTWIERWMQSVWESQPPIWDESKRQKWDEQYQSFLQRHKEAEHGNDS